MADCENEYDNNNGLIQQLCEQFYAAKITPNLWKLMIIIRQEKLHMLEMSPIH